MKASFPELAERDPARIGDPIQPPFFWGMYPEWVPLPADAFAADGWLSHCEALIRFWTSPWSLFKRHVKRMLGRPVLPAHLEMPRQWLSERTKPRGTIRVLDVGGGWGDNYFLLRRSLGRGALSYTVVDNARQCAYGRGVFARFRRLPAPAFLNKVPEAEHYDLVLLIGTLQYIQEWPSALKALCRAADNVYLSRTPLHRAGAGSFATIQSICPPYGMASGKKVGEACAWVIDEGDLAKCMESCGFRLAQVAPRDDLRSSFRRLPVRPGDIRYLDMLWTRAPAGGSIHFNPPGNGVPGGNPA